MRNDDTEVMVTISARDLDVLVAVAKEARMTCRWVAEGMLRTAIGAVRENGEDAVESAAEALRGMH